MMDHLTLGGEAGGSFKVELALHPGGIVSVQAPYLYFLSGAERLAMAKFLLQGTSHIVLPEKGQFSVQSPALTQQPKKKLPTLAEKLAEQEKLEKMSIAQKLRTELYATPQSERTALHYANAFAAALQEKFDYSKAGAFTANLVGNTARILRLPLPKGKMKIAFCFIGSSGAVYRAHSFSEAGHAVFSLAHEDAFLSVIDYADSNGDFLKAF